jgi:membrane-bound metal-dependent hydrolase YbcI (DUF457 family)
MDVFTHAVLPLAAFALLRRRWLGLAAGLGAATPDADALFTWLARVDPQLWFTVHRGWSHTLWGAPLLGLLALALLSRPWCARRWPRLGAFRATPLAAEALVLGAWSHLGLDALTISGVPALWPLSAQRFTLNLFFFSALYMVPVSAYLVWRLARGTLGDRLLARGALLLVLALAAGGSLRAATMPHVEGAVVQPTPNELRWVVAEPLPGGWRVREAGPMADARVDTFTGNASAEAAGAVRRAEGLGAHTAWAWTNPAPVVNATRLADGWRVEFRDAVAMHRNATGGLLAGLVREPRPLVVEVRGGTARAVEQPAWFGV